MLGTTIFVPYVNGKDPTLSFASAGIDPDKVNAVFTPNNRIESPEQTE